jgi:uncharacterized protein
MEVNPEIFVIPNERNFILYNPLAGSVLEVSSGVIREMQSLLHKENYSFDGDIEKTLLERKFIGENFPKFFQSELNEKYTPTSVTFMPSWDCNLRCNYCYSHGGENPGELMNLNIAKSAVDFIVKNALENKSKEIHVGYHGGGEPLNYKNMGWINEITHYSREKAKEKKLNSKIGSATNGFLSKTNLEWIVNNLDSVNVSLDGPEDIQNRQRPNKFGGPSYKSVLRAINFFEENKFSYGIRATITDESVNRMEEILNHFSKISSIKQFHLEPLFECGRCETTGSKAPSSEDFIKNFIKTKETAVNLGVKIYSSGSELERIGFKFCGAAGNNFFVTPDGNVTTCLEVSRPNDNMNDIFIVGEFNKEKNEFEFNEEKLNALRKRNVQNVNGCEDCFAKYNCSGDCLAKACAVSGSLYDSRKNIRCDANKTLLLHEIKEKLKKNKGVQ